ncbi:hypothetical protein [Vibrio sp. CAU 1672]|uniref:hypothetical protein n=1 Tax=Vibrio sp. CAU 1672 TaxID=3032594 RepID=UPI0023DB6DEB|nr:hypothetical protein [Vibrio sp. CAU 1672]MDF2154515.1 hypothetical protein [Vibrio sp. CAU 1672]
MIAIPPTTIPSIISAITKIASSIGPMIAKYAPIVIETIGKNLPKVINTIEAVSLVADVLRPNERAEDLGAKAMAADKKPEDFEKMNEYIDYLRNGVEIDKDKLSDDTVDVMTRQAIGSAIAVKGVSEKIGTDVTLPFLNTVSGLDLDPKVVVAIVKSYAESGLNADDVEKFLGRTLSIEDTYKHGVALKNAFLASDPSIDAEQAEDAVMSLR